MQASAKAPMWEFACVLDEVERGQKGRNKRPKGNVIGIEVREVTKGTVLVGLYQSWSK